VAGIIDDVLSHIGFSKQELVADIRLWVVGQSTKGRVFDPRLQPHHQGVLPIPQDRVSDDTQDHGNT
jgi:hypothetical protein